MRRVVLALSSCLLALPTCASLPRMVKADAWMLADAQLPPFPEWVPTQRGAVPVRLVKNLRCGDRMAWGCYYHASRTIQIEDSLVLWRKWETLRHEIVHAALHNAGLTLANQASEDSLADALARQQIGEMLSGWPAPRP